MDINVNKIVVGQKVFIKIIERSNAARYIKSNKVDDWIYEGLVIKIGRKYITVRFNNGREEKFDKKDNHINISKYSADYQLYLTKQEIVDKMEINKLYEKIQYNFNNWNNNNRFNLDQLRRIVNIIDEKN